MEKFMAKKQIKRDEVDKNYQWDLTPIFKNKEEFYKTLEKVEKEIYKIQDFKGKIVENGKKLFQINKH